MYDKRLCTRCDGITVRFDVCSNCRKKEVQKKEKPTSRAETDRKAEIEQSMTMEQARWLYKDAMHRISFNSLDMEAWRDKRRARARIFREDTH